MAALSVSATSGALPISPTRVTEKWDDICASEFEMLKGHKFTLLTDSGEAMRLKLTKVIAGKSGPARPKQLPRKEGLIAVFEAPKSDCAWFVENGHQSVDMRHPALGTSRVFLGAVPSRSGGHKIEMVLN